MVFRRSHAQISMRRMHPKTMETHTVRQTNKGLGMKQLLRKQTAPSIPMGGESNLGDDPHAAVLALNLPLLQRIPGLQEQFSVAFPPTQ